jgi:hypothetical protein
MQHRSRVKPHVDPHTNVEHTEGSCLSALRDIRHISDACACGINCLHAHDCMRLAVPKQGDSLNLTNGTTTLPAAYLRVASYWTSLHVQLSILFTQNVLPHPHHIGSHTSNGHWVEQPKQHPQEGACIHLAYEAAAAAAGREAQQQRSGTDVRCARSQLLSANMSNGSSGTLATVQGRSQHGQLTRQI